jgi:hypothetical protein
MSQYLWNETTGQTSRRRFVWMAMSVPAAMVMPLGLAGSAHAEPDRDLREALAAISPPRERSNYFTVHHVGCSCTHTATRPCTFSCDGSTCSYDFVIGYGGRLTVCPAHSNRTGSHAKGCNCNTLGVLLAGCFGCNNGNCGDHCNTRCPENCGDPALPSYAQECTLASVMLQVQQATDHADYTASSLIPHRNCNYWQPCGSGTSTVCPGVTLTQGSGTNSSWSSGGLGFRNRVITKYRNLARCCTCSGNPCCA